MSYFVTSDDVRLYYQYTPSKTSQTLVFVHGWLVNWSCFKKEISSMKKQGHGVLYLDLRGHGKSSDPDGLSAYALPRIATDVIELIKYLHVKKPILVGHSLGGMVCLQVAALHPLLPKSLVIIDSSFRNPLFSLPLSIVRHNRGFAKHLIDYLSRHVSSHKKVLPFLSNDFSLSNRNDTNIFLHGLLNTPLHACISVLEAMTQFDLRKNLSSITCSVLVIGSEHDQLFTASTEKKLASLLPHAKYIEEDATHSSIIKEPEEISDWLTWFIDQET